MTDVKKLNNPSQNLWGRFADFLLRNKFIILSFLVPFVIMVGAFGFMGVSPLEFLGELVGKNEGKKQILVTDLWHQYYPFLVDFQSKLKSGESMFWSWAQGAGVNYFSLMSYYLASPINFLSVFVPSEFLREFLMFSVAFKIALSGAFMAYFLRSVYKKNDITLLLFGCSFSFCAFYMGYYWNTIWLDTVCITPLVALGIVKLLTENRFRLYTVTLAIALLTNYYIGLFICIFVLLIFICYNIINWKGFTNFLGDLFKTGAFSILAIGLTAFFLLPAFYGLQNTHASGSTFPADFAINIGGSNDIIGVLNALRSIVVNLLNFTCAANKAADAIPNISCGAISIFFGFLFLTSKKIKLREKIVNVCLILFMFLSCIIRQLDYIWHGFHFTNMIPYRFSFLISFVIIVMAFRAFSLIDFSSALNVLVAAFCCVALLLLSLNEPGTETQFVDHMDWLKPTLIGSAIFLAVTAVIVLLYTKRIVPKKALLIVMTVLVIGQSCVTAYCGVFVTTVTTTYEYPRGGSEAEAVFDYMNSIEENTPELWRAEVTSTQTLNDGSLNGYNGISMFNSMANESMTIFSENFGMMGWKSGNRYTYAEGSPVTNLFMNLKYLVARDGSYQNTYDLSEVYSAGNKLLLKNNHYLPMGFMTNSKLSSWTENENEDQYNPFDTQNQFFKLATGIDEDVYIPLQVVSQGHTDSTQFRVNKLDYGNYSFSCIDTTVEPHLKWNYEAPEDGLYLMYADITDGDDVTVMQNDQAQSKKYGMGRSYIASIGYFSKGDKISVYVDLEAGKGGNAKVYVNMLNKEVFERGYDILARDVMTTEELTGSSMKGTIDVSQDGLFYTSVPYEEGWNAVVDGEKVEIKPVGGSLVAFPLSSGKHSIELYYYPKGFWMGLAVSVVCALIFAAICVYVYIIRKRPGYVPKFSFSAESGESEETAVADVETLDASESELSE